MKDVSLTPEGFYQMRPATAVAAADKLIKLKEENKVWESIELIVEIWQKSRPQEYKSYLVQLEDARENLHDKKHGKSKRKGSNLRRTMDIPEMVISMIRKLYSPDELPMDKKFFIAWSRKFPGMMVSEKF